MLTDQQYVLDMPLNAGLGVKHRKKLNTSKSDIFTFGLSAKYCLIVFTDQRQQKAYKRFAKQLHSQIPLQTYNYKLRILQTQPTWYRFCPPDKHDFERHTILDIN